MTGIGLIPLALFSFQGEGGRIRWECRGHPYYPGGGRVYPAPTTGGQSPLCTPLARALQEAEASFPPTRPRWALKARAHPPVPLMGHGEDTSSDPRLFALIPMLGGGGPGAYHSPQPSFRRAAMRPALQTFLRAHTPLAEETTAWGGGRIPLRATAYLSGTLPPARYTTSARCLLVRGRSVLLCRNRDGVHILPGGRLERGESSEAALRREVLEETGWALASVRSIRLSALSTPGAAAARLPAALVPRLLPGRLPGHAGPVDSRGQAAGRLRGGVAVPERGGGATARSARLRGRLPGRACGVRLCTRGASTSSPWPPSPGQEKGGH